MIRISVQCAQSDRRDVPVSANRRKRGNAVKLVLATLALVGIGAAATSAAWTDDAFFTSSASAASVQLKGALANCDSTSCTWLDANTSSGSADPNLPVAVPGATFSNLVPSDSAAVTKTVELWLKNTGTSNLAVALTCTKSTGGVWGGSAPLTLSFDNGLSCGGGTLTLVPSTPTKVVMTVTVPKSWDASYKGASGTLTLQFTGTAS